jgi:hypothetical protein
MGWILEKIDPGLTNLSRDLNDDLFCRDFGRRGRRLIVKLEGEASEKKKGDDKKDPLLTDGKVFHMGRQRALGRMLRRRRKICLGFALCSNPGVPIVLLLGVCNQSSPPELASLLR